MPFQKNVYLISIRRFTQFLDHKFHKMEIDLIAAQNNDKREILGMMQQFYAIDDYGFYPDQAGKTLDHFLKDPQLGALWIITQGKLQVGYIVLSFGFSFEYGGRDAFIDEFFLKEDFRGKGIGSKVMALVEEKAIKLGVKAIHLEVENHNDKALKLYANNGYSGNDRKLLTKIPANR